MTNKLPLEYQKVNFACKCCKRLDDPFNSIPKFQKLLRQIFIETKVKFPINSAFRCLKHNIEVGGVPNSDHLRMLAIDIGYTGSLERILLLKSIMRHINEYPIRYLKLYPSLIHISFYNPKDKYQGGGYPAFEVKGFNL